MRIAVRGDPTVARAIRDAGGAVVVDADASADAAASADVDAVIAVGERALRDAILAGDAPILAVDAPGPYSISADEVAGGLAALDEASRVPARVLGLGDGETLDETAVFDAALMTTEPAKISEYALHADGRVVDRFRADGVVVATPLGSHGYARAAGGPIVEPGTGLTVVPVSPFATNADAWVLQPGFRLAVERDESRVSLFADDREVGDVTAGGSITVSIRERATLLDPGLA